MTNRTGSKGFTLIELMVTITIVAILIAIAVPSFQNYIRNNTVLALQNQLATAITTARSEAASRNVRVTICPLNATADGCGAATEWSNGWVVFEDTAMPGSWQPATEESISLFENGGGYTVAMTAGTGTVAVPSFSFNSQGFLMGGVQPVAKICDPDVVGTSLYARALTVQNSGMLVKSRHDDTDDYHDHPLSAGQNLVCP